MTNYKTTWLRIKLEKSAIEVITEGIIVGLLIVVPPPDGVGQVAKTIVLGMQSIKIAQIKLRETNEMLLAMSRRLKLLTLFVLTKMYIK